MTRRDEQKRSMRARAGVCGMAALALVGVVLAAMLIAGPLHNERAAYDQNAYHLVAVRAFAEQLAPGPPKLDLSDYPSATSPGYHLLLAVIAMLGDATVTLRAAGASIGVALFALAGWLVGGRLGAGPAGGASEPGAPQTPDRAGGSAGVYGAVLCLPFALSLYVVSSLGWALPDNAGWLCVGAMLGLVGAGPMQRRLGWRGLLLAGAIGAAAVFVRQIHVWCVSMLWAAVWLDAAADRNEGWGWLTRAWPERLKAMLPALLVSVGAFAILGWLVWLWGGLVPPDFQEQTRDPATGAVLPKHTGLSLSFLVVTLAVVGVAGPWFLCVAHRRVIALLRDSRASLWHVAAGCAMVAVYAALIDTSFSRDEGRYSGLWQITKAAEFGSTSVLMVLLSAVGGGCCVLFWKLLPVRERVLYAVAIAGPTAAYTFNAKVWPRYVEPWVLLALALATAAVLAAGNEKPRWWWLVGLAPLTLFHAAITARGM